MRCILGSPALNFGSEQLRVMQSAKCKVRKASCTRLIVSAENFTLLDKLCCDTAITYGTMDVKRQMLLQQTIANKFLFIEIPLSTQSKAKQR